MCFNLKVAFIKKLVLSFELSWRTKADTAFLHSAAWKKLRKSILVRDNFTCQYCGYVSEKGLQVNHINGDPKDNNPDNLEVVCSQCHMIMHSGLWASVHHTIIIFKRSEYSQNEIIQITRELRNKGKTDNEIISYLGLKDQVPWRQDLDYLSKLYGFITSAKIIPSGHHFLTEEEQRARIKAKDE